jgi:hypothetical protein
MLTPHPASTTPATLPPTRTERNAALLAQCHPVFARKVEAILRDLEGHGCRPRLQEAFRTVARQRALKRKGYSTLSWGFHCAVSVEGFPQSLAVDLIDEDSPVEASTRFVLLLASAAQAHGCETGLLWGVSVRMRTRIRRALRTKDWGASITAGWDPLHVQISGISLAEAKRGLRPHSE